MTRVLNVSNKMDNCATHSGVTFAVSVKTPDTGLNNYLRKVTKQDRCMSYSEKNTIHNSDFLDHYCENFEKCVDF